MTAATCAETLAAPDRAGTLAADLRDPAAEFVAFMRELSTIAGEIVCAAMRWLTDHHPIGCRVDTPEWLSVRDAVFGALTVYPEARAVVAGRLLELEAAT